MLRHLLSLSIFCCAQGAGAWAAEDGSQCAADLQPRIEVTFHDREVRSSNNLTVLELNRIAGNRRDERHNVYGLTYANPDFKMMVKVLAAEGTDGSLCAVPDIAIDLGFSDFRVYLAKELTDPCQQTIIREHEEEHVKTWRSQLRASAQLLATTLRNNAGAPRLYANAAEAKSGVNAWAIELVTPWIRRIFASVRGAQAAIDTQTSYDIVTSRLRTCGGVVRGGSR